MKIKKTEAELVQQYCDRVINGKIARGHIDNRFKYTEGDGTVTNKNMHLDTDFYFSVVFQSQEQKYEFLKAIGIPTEEHNKIQIMNGLKLAKLFTDKGVVVKLKKESSLPFPNAALDLRPLILDNTDMNQKP